MNAITSFIATEPVRIQALISALVVLISMLGLHLTVEQTSALAVVLVIVGSELARLRVTPNASLPQPPKGPQP